MGINPGEQHEDFVTAPCPPVHEESFEIDFHEQYGKGRSAVKWTKTTEAFCETKQYIQSEMFFWSSKDIGMLESRFGSLTARNQPNKHLEFCNRLNRELINLTAPSAIVVPGIGCTKIMSKNFNLTFEDSIKDPESNHRLCERYSDKERTWLFTKHWSGAHGFSSDQRAIVKREIQSLNT